MVNRYSGWDMKKIISLLVALVCFLYSYAQGEHLNNSKGVLVATWNIGHFSKGQKDHSLISSSELSQKVDDYRSFIYDSIKADILCVNEYERVFCSDSAKSLYAITEKMLFNNYRSRQIFDKNSFVCNAIFSNKKMKNAAMHPFLYNLFAKDERSAIEWHYYAVTDITIQGEKVKLICTHLVPLAEKHCQNQIKELLYFAEKYPKVIICGDMNTWDFSKFRKAGYTLANDGSIVTFPSKSYALDNIFVKGLNMSDVKVIKTGLSDHYALLCRISL